jgi:hypothetical protein
MSKRWIAVLALLALAAAVVPLVASAGGENPMTGTWKLTLRFTNDAFPQQSHSLALQEDGHWSCAEWGMQGYWDRPDSRTFTLSGERTVEPGVTEAFAITGAKIRGDYDAINGSFVLWRQPSWAQVKWTEGEVSGTRQ